ncbi:NepR family anti-sigma factor [Methylobacterium gnaphalii]|uniref:NepR family anti-sigma factor n=1 Tax=Methylobacterium gnaphalii TaxID=1010610 RepID=UPI0011BD60EB|nr:NepR family anti-sigma factor [Methylobacterium gnaphalii]
MNNHERDRSRFGQPAPRASNSDAEKSPAIGGAAEARRRIGRGLRLLYAGVLNQPLPERLTRLVDVLAAQDRSTEGPR